MKDFDNLKELQLNIYGEENMKILGSKLLEASNYKGIFYLNGRIGAGKTTLCRGMITATGYTGTVKSPTFTLVEPYNISGEKNLYHFDLYRFNDPEEFELVGGREYFNKENIILIEWSNKAKDWLPEPDLTIEIIYKNEHRNIFIKSSSRLGEKTIYNLKSTIQDKNY